MHGAQHKWQHDVPRLDCTSHKRTNFTCSISTIAKKNSEYFGVQNQCHDFFPEVLKVLEKYSNLLGVYWQVHKKNPSRVGHNSGIPSLLSMLRVQV